MLPSVEVIYFGCSFIFSGEVGVRSCVPRLRGCVSHSEAAVFELPCSDVHGTGPRVFSF